VDHLITRIAKHGLYSASISVNGLHVPAKLIEDHLARYCTSLGVYTDDADYPIYIPGSATLMKYKGRYFMICTRHQLKHTPNFENVCLLLPHADGRTKCITSGGARWFDGLNEGDHHQIVVFDFTDPCRENEELKPMFFDFRHQHTDIQVDRLVAFTTYGYLTSLANVDYDNGKIAQVRAQVLSRFATPGTDDALHMIEPLSPLDFDPDGMSGGPTFCVVLDPPNNFSVHLAGVTVRGGRDRLMVIKAGAVQAVLDTVVRDKPLV
jgi:hypothetical protein